MEFSSYHFVCIILLVSVTQGMAKVGLTNSDDEIVAANSIQHHQCQESCLQKYTINATACLQTPVCSKCWQLCSESTQTQKPWPIRVATMVKQEFLVATHLAWEPSNVLVNCLVTWEVYGGGLMGNLLTDTSNVELSLWPDTKYRVEVTCKNKMTDETIKSLPIVVDTSNAIEMKPEPDQSSNYIQQSIAGRTAVRNDHQTVKSTKNDDKQKLREVAIYFTLPIASWEAKHPYLKQSILGGVAALIAFLFVLTVFLALRKRFYDNKTDAYLREVKINIDR
ncbi:transmembrane protein fend-like [Bradysia coprophila]|uniref:transmembrane protein fend-like n=1 Tax=Bradysia coprophila TaxID=38358 RepID=UPI00187D71CC|nr:transmembrane protein fend-like [Bradysia coprophila]